MREGKRAPWLGRSSALHWARERFSIERYGMDTWIVIDKTGPEEKRSDPIGYNKAKSLKINSLLLAALHKMGIKYDGGPIPNKGNDRDRFRELCRRHGSA